MLAGAQQRATWTVARQPIHRSSIAPSSSFCSDELVEQRAAIRCSGWVVKSDWMPDRPARLPGVKRVAELASKLAVIDPTARDVRELFVAFQEVEDHYRRPQPIETAPHEPGMPLQLYCPKHGGWHYGEWQPGNIPRWVAVIHPADALQPTHWRPGEPPAV